MNYTHLPAISCYYSNAPLPLHCNPEAHFEYEMILVSSGNTVLFVNHKTYPVAGKSLIFINRLERHSLLVKQTPYERYVTTVSNDVIMSNINDMELVSIFIQRPEHFNHVIHLDDPSYELLLPLFIQLEREYREQPPLFVSKSISLVTSILIELYRTHPENFPLHNHSRISTAVINAQKYINDHYDRKLTLDEVARQNFISSHALSIAFKNFVGISFKDYLILFRLTEAKKMLISTDASVAEIAEKVGYMNVNNFIRIFKEKESLTPLQYRRQHRSLTPL